MLVKRSAMFRTVDDARELIAAPYVKLSTGAPRVRPASDACDHAIAPIVHGATYYADPLAWPLPDESGEYVIVADPATDAPNHSNSEA